MKPSYPRLRASSSGMNGATTSDALVLCFYMKHAHQHLARPVLRSLELLRERIQPHRLAWDVAPDGQMHEMDDARWGHIREEMLGPNKAAVLRLEDSRLDAGGFFVDYRGLPLPLPWAFRARDTSVLYLRLPTEYLEERGPAHVRALALDIAEELPFNSGYADLCLCGMDTVPGPDQNLMELVKHRYPGMHLAGGGADLRVDTLIDGVHWMNFLGPPVLGRLGGISTLRQHLGYLDTSLHEMSADRVLLILGEWPELGDTGAGETLPKHGALARLIEPHLYHRERLHGLSQEDLRRWERRFLEVGNRPG